MLDNFVTIKDNHSQPNNERIESDAWSHSANSPWGVEEQEGGKCKEVWSSGLIFFSMKSRACLQRRKAWNENVILLPSLLCKVHTPNMASKKHQRLKRQAPGLCPGHRGEVSERTGSAFGPVGDCSHSDPPSLGTDRALRFTVYAD